MSLEAMAAGAAGGALSNVVLPILSKLVGQSADIASEALAGKLAVYRLKNQVAVLKEVAAYCEAAGINPQQVNMKVLTPLLENCALESEPALQTRWAALLANAADPNFKEPVRPDFVKILSEVTANEVRIMDHMYNYLSSVAREQWHRCPFLVGDLKNALGIPERECELARENLLRLRICGMAAAHLGPDAQQYQGIHLTPYGYTFVTACTWCPISPAK